MYQDMREAKIFRNVTINEGSIRRILQFELGIAVSAWPLRIFAAKP